MVIKQNKVFIIGMWLFFSRNDPPAMSINVPISSHAPFGTSVDEEDDDYDS